MKDRHHWVPLGIMGTDIKQNIVTIDRLTHQHIHQVMNYDMRTYSQMMRVFRRKHNHKSRWDIEMVNDILRMQEGYLSRYTLLAPGPERLHFKVMNDLVRYYEPNHVNQYVWSKLWYEYCEAFKHYNLWDAVSYYTPCWSYYRPVSPKNHPSWRRWLWTRTPMKAYSILYMLVANILW